MVRRAWLVGGSLFTAVLLGFTTLQVVVALAHEQRTTVEQFDATGLREVRIHNDAGRVRVIGTESDVVTVRAEISDGYRPTGHTERVDGARLVLDTSCPIFLSSYCDLTYVVEVPAGLHVSVWSPDQVSVEDVTGDVVVESEGAIELARIGGTVQATSNSGAVSALGLTSSDVDLASDLGGVTVDFARQPSAVRVTSDLGDIEVVLPDTASDYRVSSTTDLGATTTEISTDPDSERSITASTDDGDVTIRYASR